MYLQITQAALRLNCSRQWVHELINRGVLHTSEIAGRRFVVCDEQFVELARERQQKQADSKESKAASAKIAKIPLPLSQHIARVYKPKNP